MTDKIGQQDRGIAAPPVIWRLVYDGILVPIGWIIFRLFALVDRKARRALRGRRNLWADLETSLARCPSGKCRVWFHVSSMGEFEQAKPVIAELKRSYKGIQIIVSFFSPSGLEHSRKYPLADVITYIPFDSRRNAERFVRTVNPSVAILVRYDLWPNHIWTLQRAGIPIVLASATLRRSGVQSLPLVKDFYRALYNSVDSILTVSESDRAGFESLHLTHPFLGVIGDTRYDQVGQRSAEAKKRQIIDASILTGKWVVVVGSSWGEDEQVVLTACFRLFQEHPEMLVILVPHEPTLENLEGIEHGIGGRSTSIRFSLLSQYSGERIILIDSVGILTTLYRYGRVADVGGSFRSGIHNVLEPAVYGIPVLMGPVHDNSQEAVEIVREGAGFVCPDEDEVVRILGLFIADEETRQRVGEKAAGFVRQRTGATGRLLEHLEVLIHHHT
jgi:3-deoxy-D-manno-octulosonic-acid transferase